MQMIFLNKKKCPVSLAQMSSISVVLCLVERKPRRTGRSQTRTDRLTRQPVDQMAFLVGMSL